MGSRQIAIVIDADDADALRAFWVAALGYDEFGAAGQYRSAVPADGAPGPKLLIQQVPEGRPAAKNRVHIDIAVGDEIEAECLRLTGLGAQRRSDVINEAGVAWIVMADPEGNEFCLVHHT